jgi:glycine/D-amino acid oxidase-like deaminating enzyme
VGSFWLEEEAAPLPATRLHGEPEVVVVGGGVTGCSCALTLAQAGVRVRLHEARAIASGASGRNGGFALRGGLAYYDAARSELGPELARHFWELTERTLDRMAELAGDAFVRTGSVRLADESEVALVRGEYEALIADGFDAVWHDDLPPRLAALYAAALEHPDDGSLRPARWVRRLARQAAEAGAELREHDPVASVEELGDVPVVIATDGYTTGLVPFLDEAIRATRGQVLVTEPLPEMLYGRPHYARYGFDYWQQLPDGRLVLGGQRDTSPESEWTAVEETTPLIQGRLEALLEGLLGRVPPITHRWAGIFGSSPDGMPLAGRVGGTENLWVAAGYSGHGNVLGLACGDLVARAILGEAPPELALFDPARLVSAI